MRIMMLEEDGDLGASTIDIGKMVLTRGSTAKRLRSELRRCEVRREALGRYPSSNDGTLEGHTPAWRGRLRWDHRGCFGLIRCGLLRPSFTLEF